MHVVIADSRGTILWLSHIAPHFREVPIIGTSLFDWVAEPARSAMAAAAGAAFMRGEVVPMDVDVVAGGNELAISLLFVRVGDLLAIPWRLNGDGQISKRERQVLECICEGMTPTEIGVFLGISKSTVESHRANILRKTDSDCNVTLCRWAIRHGLMMP